MHNNTLFYEDRQKYRDSVMFFALIFAAGSLIMLLVALLSIDLHYSLGQDPLWTDIEFIIIFPSVSIIAILLFIFRSKSYRLNSVIIITWQEFIFHKAAKGMPIKKINTLDLTSFRITDQKKGAFIGVELTFNINNCETKFIIYIRFFDRLQQVLQMLIDRNKQEAQQNFLES